MRLFFCTFFNKISSLFILCHKLSQNCGYFVLENKIKQQSMFAILVFIGIAANVLSTICGGSDNWSK